MITQLTGLLGIEHPILLAPMGSVSGGVLAKEVSTAGGLGLIGAGYGDPAWLKSELDHIAGVRPFGVGFITWSLTKAPSAFQLALSYGPDVVMFSFGDAAPYIKQCQRAGARVICQVQTVDDARRACDDGADVIVAQGTEAGGHGGGRSLFPLLPAVVDAVEPVPVVAAGGISDGRGLASALMLGAAGVLIGTRFAASHEALLSPAAKRSLVQSFANDTVRTTVFDIVRGYSWPAPYTGRAVRNDFVNTWHGKEDALRSNLATQKRLYRSACGEDDLTTMVVFAGEGVDGVHSIEPARTLVRRVVNQAHTSLMNGRSAMSGLGEMCTR